MSVIKYKKNDNPEFYQDENFFSGIYGLRKSGVLLDYSEIQVKEIYNCMNEKYYLAENYIRIKGEKTGGMVPFKYRPYQKEISDTIDNNKYTIILASRQSGKSITLGSKVVEYILFNSNALVMIIAQKEKQARKLLEDIKRMYLELPMFLQSGVISWNKNSIVLENGCAVKIEATTEDSARGETVNFLILDEFGIVPKNIAESFWSAVEPTVSSIEDSKVVIASTPKGMNHLYDMWKGAETKTNGFIPLKYTWRDVPGRDESWKIKKLASNNMTPARFRQEYEVEFMGSTGTLIASDVLANIETKEPIKQTNNCNIYEDPEPDTNYVMTVDTGYGAEQDKSTFNIFKINSDKYTQVVVFKSNEMEPEVFATYCAQYAKIYNMATIVPESNDIGLITISTLQNELDYPNVVHVRDKTMRKAGYKKGLRMTSKVKKIGCIKMKELIESGKLEINDFDTLMELSVFIKISESYKADTGCTDDIVMGIVMFAYFTNTVFFEDISKSSKSSNVIGKITETEKDLRSILKLFGKVEGDELPYIKDII